ncbi:MAG: ribonuclease III domain-containing protein [candidate division WOR-3 bacterium]
MSESPDTIERKKISIYNPNNHLITIQDIVDIFKKCELNYHPNNLYLYQLSLTHKSYVIVSNPDIDYDFVPNCVELQSESNERLEYLGDSIIGAVTSVYLFHRYPKQHEGFLTKIKTKLVRTKMLSKFSLYLGLNQYLLISKHVEDMCNGRFNDHILEDTFEAFIGALFEDIYQDNPENYGHAMQTCSNFITRLIEDTTDFRPLISINDNYKELLLQYYHKTWSGIHPVYITLKEEGPKNKRIFTMGIYHPITGQLIGQGTDRKKVYAEQNASREALLYFEQHPEQSCDKRINPKITSTILMSSTSPLSSNQSVDEDEDDLF